MKDKIKDIFNKIRTNKRLFFIVSLTVMVLFCLVLNITFSAFTASRERNAVNIIVGLNYTTDLNNNTFQVPAGQVTKTNITLVSNNNIDTRYEITYEICANAACTSTVNPPVTGLTVEYSSKSPGGVNDVVSKLSTKVIRLVVTNTSSTTYYIKVGINAGFKNNAVDTTGLNTITSEYDESDLTIQTYINGTASSTFPTSANYWATLSCVDILGNPLSTSGSAVYKNSQWYIRIDNLTNAETTCSVNFSTTAHLTKIEDLVVLSNNTNDGMTYSGVTFYLDNDLNFNNNSSYADYTRTDFGDINRNGTVEQLKTELTTGEGFMPIATGSTYFSGTFNGQSHTISNLYVNATVRVRPAFFSKVRSATISNLTITGNVSWSGSAANDLGGLIAYGDGTTSISNVTNSVNTSSTFGGGSNGGIIGAMGGTVTLSNVTNTGSISNSNNAGGIVGYNGGSLTINTANNTGTISNTLGGFAGSMLARDNAATNTTTITGATNSGQITVGNAENSNHYVGGLVGYIYGTVTISNSSNSAAVTSSNTTTTVAYKNLAGILGATGADSPQLWIYNCTNTGNITGGTRVGGLVGTAQSADNLVLNSSNTGTVASGISYTSTVQGGGLVSVLATNKTLRMINSYNTGAVNISATGAGVMASGLVGIGLTGSSYNIYNSYNLGNVTVASETDKYANGIVHRNGSGTSVINNAYNYGTITGGNAYTIGFISSSGTGLTVTNTFYLNTTTPSNVSGFGTSKTTTNFTTTITTTSSVGYALNQARSGITLPSGSYPIQVTLKEWTRRSTTPRVPIFSS